MNTIAAVLRQRLVNFAIFAYRALVLYFFLVFLLAFLFDEGGWINWFIVFLILSFPLGLVLLSRRLRHKQGKE